MNYPFVSVAVVARNAEKHIAECLDSIENLDYPKDKYEILLIDGNSTDNTVSIAKIFKRVDILNNDKKIISTGRNLAIDKAKGKYLAFTDSDCKVDTNWLKNLILINDLDKNTVAVGGPNLVFDSDPILARVIGHMQETFLGSGGSPQSYKIKEMSSVVSLANCNVIYKKNIINSYRYNERINVGEDAELNYRLKKDGYHLIYTNKAVVWHHRRNKIKNFIKNMFNYGKAQAKINRIHKKLVRGYSILPTLVIFLTFLMVPLIILNNQFIVAYILLFSIYFLLTFTSSIYVIKRTGLAGALSLILLPIQHVSYGLGYLIGVKK